MYLCGFFLFRMKNRLQAFPIAFISAIYLLLNWYILSGLKTLIHENYFIALFWLVICSSTVAVIYSLLIIKSKGMGLIFKIATHAFLMLFVSEILFLIILLTGDTYLLFLGIYHLIIEQEFVIPPRSSAWISIGVGLFFSSIFMFVYGILKGKYAYKVIKHTLHFNNLPVAFDGLTITQISDIHAGSFTNVKEVIKGINIINEQKSDLFVFTGDLVNNKAEEIKPWISHFSKIKAPLGQFSVLGNHDYGDYINWGSDTEKRKNFEQLKNYHNELGFQLLLDEHITIQKDGQKIILAGIENWGLGFGERGDLEKALKGTRKDDFKILLSHDPSHWEAQVKDNKSDIHLSLAGHTHGMQFGIEFLGIKWSPVKIRYKHWAGVKEENGRVLNINRGFGFIGFSGRIGIWPEITVIKLKKSL